MLANLSGDSLYAGTAPQASVRPLFDPWGGQLVLGIALRQDWPVPDTDDIGHSSHFSSDSRVSERRVAQAAEDCARSHALVRSGLVSVETVARPGSRAAAYSRTGAKHRKFFGGQKRLNGIYFWEVFGFSP